MELYDQEYKAFIASFKEQPVSGFEVGELIVRMANYFSDYNLAMVYALRDFNQKKREAESEVDGNGKPISSTKASVMADSTPEAHAYQLARAHVQNVEQIINSLKAMQKGVLSEYSNSSLQ